MSTSTISKQDRVINYLIRGKTLSQDSAWSMFQVANLRATMSDIRPLLKSKGFLVIKNTGRFGETRYGVVSHKKRS